MESQRGILTQHSRRSELKTNAQHSLTFTAWLSQLAQNCQSNSVTLFVKLIGPDVSFFVFVYSVPTGLLQDVVEAAGVFPVPSAQRRRRGGLRGVCVRGGPLPHAVGQPLSTLHT